jgi:hypothetical protein
MLVAWTKHLKDPEEKQRFTNSLYHSKFILDSLSNLLDDMVKELEQEEISPRSYDNPNWAYRQAHANGFKQSIAKVKKLITLDQQKETQDEFTRPK